jgi:hypothetical protein
MARRGGWLTAIIGTGLVLVGGRAAGQQELRWRFRPGETLHYVRSDEWTTLDGDRKVTMHFSRTYEMTWRVETVEPDGAARIVQTIDRVRHSVKKPPQEESVYDSASVVAPAAGAASRFTAAIKPLIGAEFSFTLTPLGEVRDLELSEKTRKLAGSQATPSAWLLNDDALTRLVPTVPLPKAAVRPGTTWTETDSVAIGVGTKNLTRTFRYIGDREREGKRIERIETEVETVVNPRKNLPYESKILSPTTRGAIAFDRDAGRLVQRSERDLVRSITIDRGKAFESETEGIEITTLVPRRDLKAP